MVTQGSIVGHGGMVGSTIGSSVGVGVGAGVGVGVGVTVGVGVGVGAAVRTGVRVGVGVTVGVGDGSTCPCMDVSANESAPSAKSPNATSAMMSVLLDFFSPPPGPPSLGTAAPAAARGARPDAPARLASRCTRKKSEPPYPRAA